MAVPWDHAPREAARDAGKHFKCPALAVGKTIGNQVSAARIQACPPLARHPRRHAPGPHHP